jgi:hypothetical protein
MISRALVLALAALLPAIALADRDRVKCEITRRWCVHDRDCVDRLDDQGQKGGSRCVQGICSPCHEPAPPRAFEEPGESSVAADQPHRRRPDRRRASRRRTGAYVASGVVAMVPLGGWRQHAYAGNLAGASGLDQFGPGAGARIDLGLHWRRFTIAMELEVNSLDTQPWDEYAARHGSLVRSRAMCLGTYLTLGGIVATVGPVAFTVRGGLGYAQPFGEERFEDLDLSYSYAFLRPTFSFLRQGVAASWAMTSRLDLVLGIDSTLGTSPIRRHDESLFWTFTFNLQLRLWLGARTWR